jgi:hypothetical protein
VSHLQGLSPPTFGFPTATLRFAVTATDVRAGFIPNIALRQLRLDLAAALAQPIPVRALR